MKNSILASVVLGATTALAALPAVTVKGNAFFAGNQRFYIRGIDYQPGGESQAADPLSDIKICSRDIKEFQKLGVNTVRIYAIDNSKNHDACMAALDAAGIYLALDVNTPHYAIRRDLPAPSYNHVYLQSVFATIDQFQKYNNTLLFFSGNEDINSVDTSACAPYVKAATRDMKQYIGTRGYRKIPVGYSGADIDQNRLETAHYMNCGTDDERGDFFGFNDYSWCDPSDYKTSSWERKVNDFQDFSVPIFLSEYGCTKTDRKFEEVSALYSSQMTPVYSGGLVYEYTQEGDSNQQKFGLVKVNSDGTVTEQPDFQTLANAFKNTPLPTGDGGYKSSGSASQCPPKSATFLVGNDTLPAMPQQAQQYFKNGAGTGPGLTGDGSQDSGAESTGSASAGSGQVSSTASGSSSSASSTGKSAAGSLHAPEMTFAPVVCGLVVMLSTMLGATLL